MPISSSNPLPEPSKITWITDGIATFNGSGAVQDLFNFTIGALGTKKLVIEMFLEKSLGNATAVIGFTQSAGAAYTSDVMYGSQGNLNGKTFLKFELTQSQQTSTKSNVLVSQIRDTTIAANTCVQSNFDVSAAETFYCVTNNMAATNTCIVTYSIYLVG